MGNQINGTSVDLILLRVSLATAGLLPQAPFWLEYRNSGKESFPMQKTRTGILTQQINTGLETNLCLELRFNQSSSGVFRFHFWMFGSWLEVLVDDLIPTRNDVPVFTYSKDNNEFWGALLEKAYAK